MVTVEHCFAVRAPEGWRETQAAKTMEYKAALEAAGVLVTVEHIGAFPGYLECTLPERS